MKIVCDTNILISAYIFPGGPPEEVVTLARVKEINLYLSPDIVTEFKKVLRVKFKHSEKETYDRIQSLTQIAELVYPVERLNLIERKESDNRILECALAAEADYLVTGDKKDILPMKTIGRSKIVTASQFLEFWKRN